MGCTGSAARVAVSSAKFHETYKLGKKLGEGAFGQVRLAVSRSTEQALAVKIVDVRGRDYDGAPTREVDRDRYYATAGEIKVWEAIGRSDYTVHMQSCFFERNLFYMVMEKCECSLMDKLSKCSSMTELELVGIFGQMMEGIGHVHKMKIVHRDIKPDNFLLGGVDGSVVKLCDFGLAAKLPKSGKLKGVYGTAPYMSPEMLQGSGYNELTDVWSFGATAFLMIHGDFPYSPREATAPAMKRLIVVGKPEIRFLRPADEEQFFSRDFVDRATPFLQSLLQRAPTTRRSAEEVLRMDFLSSETDTSQDVVLTTPMQSEEPPLAPVFRKARKATKDVKDLVRTQSPVENRDLDELLSKLQAKMGENSECEAPMYFSEQQEEEKQDQVPSKSNSEKRIRRRSETRHSTHSGVMLETSISKAASDADGSPAETASTTTGGGGDDSSRGSPPQGGVQAACA